MSAHLFDHVRPYLERSSEDRIAYIQAPRWIAYPGAKAAHVRLSALLSRPTRLRTQGLMIIGPYANGKTMIAERFAVEHLKTVTPKHQRVWIVQTREGAGLSHFYASVLYALKAPVAHGQDISRKAEQIDRLFERLKPRVVIFDEFHNVLRGRPKDMEAIFAFFRRIGRQFDISPVLVGEVAIHDCINATSEMASRFDLHAVPRWQYNEDYLTLLDSLESAMPLAKCSELSNEPVARRIFQLSEGLIGEIVGIIAKAAIAALQTGSERITKKIVDELRYVPINVRRRGPDRDRLL